MGVVRSFAPSTPVKVPRVGRVTGAPRHDDLVDEELQQEILLVGELVVAAGSSERHLSEDEIDQVLGVRPGPPGSAAGEPPEPTGR